MKRTSRLMATGLMTALSFLAWGCACHNDQEKVGKTETLAPQAEVQPAPVVSEVAPGMTRMTFAWPTGNPDTALAILEKTIPTQANTNQPLEYAIVVTNKDKACLDQVVVTDDLPPKFNLSSAEPHATRTDGGQLMWKIDRLPRGESRTFKVMGTPTAAGTMHQCAGISAVPTGCTEVAVVEAAIKLTNALPNEVMIWEEIPATLVVSNPGTGMAANVKVEDRLPQGLATQDGQPIASFDVGNLGPGESKELHTTLRAAKTGTYTTNGIATGSPDLRATADAPVIVRQPVLAITETGPARSYVDRPFERKIIVKNTGDGPASDSVLVSVLPRGVSVAENPDNGAVTADRISWNLGTLAPNDSRTLSYSMSASALGDYTDNSTASATYVQSVNAQATTTILGIPGILLELVDTNDPVRVGQEEVYVITATNQGSATQTNVVIKCMLEDNMTFVSGSGATGVASAEGSTITFQPLASLDAKAKAEWKVTVKGVKPADARFRIQMTGDQLTRPVTREESTTYYE